LLKTKDNEQVVQVKNEIKPKSNIGLLCR